MSQKHWREGGSASRPTSILIPTDGGSGAAAVPPRTPGACDDATHRNSGPIVLGANTTKDITDDGQRTPNRHGRQQQQKQPDGRAGMNPDAAPEPQTMSVTASSPGRKVLFRLLSRKNVAATTAAAAACWLFTISLALYLMHFDTSAQPTSFPGHFVQKQHLSPSFELKNPSERRDTQRKLASVETHAEHIDHKTRSFLDTKLLFRGHDCSVNASTSTTSITAVTQMSISPRTMQRFADLVSRWEGFISVAVYVRGDDEASRAKQLGDMDLLLSEKASLLRRCVIHLVTDTRTESRQDPEIFYPINILRNIAIEHSLTDRMLLLDVDFVPSVDAHFRLMTHLSSLAKEEEPTALILPSFERHLDPVKREDPSSSAASFGVPSSKGELLTALKTNRDKYTTFHQYFEEGHGPTDYEKWYSAIEPYQINYADKFEPYFVIENVAGLRLPLFWEHFSGFGLNKISWVNEIAFSGYTFRVAPDAFLVHINHNYQEGKYRYSRPEVKEEYKLRFNAYVRDKYGKYVWRATDAYWEELPDKAQAAARILGYDERSWDDDEHIPAQDKAVLSPNETAAVEILGLQEHFRHYSSNGSVV